MLHKNNIFGVKLKLVYQSHNCKIPDLFRASSESWVSLSLSPSCYTKYSFISAALHTIQLLRVRNPTAFQDSFLDLLALGLLHL